MFRNLTSARQRIAEHRAWETARKRVASLPEGELLAWWESTLYGLQMNREQYEKTHDTLALQEAAQGVVSLQALRDELERRAS